LEEAVTHERLAEEAKRGMIRPHARPVGDLGGLADRSGAVEI
jgi:hypothetical protein